MSIRSLLVSSTFIMITLFLASCAGQAPPSGGPIDREPPSIISVYPAPNTTLFRDQKIVFEFDEYVDRRSVEESIFISPVIGNLEFDWSGTEVELTFAEALRENTTYVVTVGTDVVDIRNRNRMAQAFSLAFSTGEEIDRGAIEGKVYPAKPEDPASGIMVVAYKLDDIDPDTLNPVARQPDYVTQTGKGGEFFLAHLGFGSYRLFAFRDEYKNLLYDPETDDFGVAQSSILLSQVDTLRSGVSMLLAREDTTAPRLIKVSPVDRYMVVAEFSEPIDTGTVAREYFVLSDTVGSLIEIRDVSARLPRLKEFYVATGEQEGGAVLRLRVDNVKDLSGRSMSPIANTLDFTAADAADTLAPGVAAFSVRDSARSVGLDASIFVYLSEPVQKVALVNLELRDSTNQVVSIDAGWVNSATIFVAPQSELKGMSWYTLSLGTGMLVDRSANRGKDTVIIARFQTMDPDRLSSIAGTVTDRNEVDTVGSIYVVASNIAQKESGKRTATIQKPGRFLIDKLVEGRYTLRVFRDRNGNGILDPGRVFPFSIPERFLEYPDTLKLRARWPLEDVELRLK